MQRRLAAILAADMVGCSRLMGVDEEGTIARQKAHRAELIDPEIAARRGRVVKTTGDGLLIEFASVIDTVKCAVVVQQAMADREADVRADQRIQYRVGINLGDIVSTEKTSWATGSTSPHDRKGWPSRAESVFRRRCSTRSATNSTSGMRTSEIKM